VDRATDPFKKSRPDKRKADPTKDPEEDPEDDSRWNVPAEPVKEKPTQRKTPKRAR
jgi:hypothetical protein